MRFGWEVPSWFDAGSHRGLVWLAQEGIGICREPTPPDLYDLAYWKEYRRRDHTEMGVLLTEKRRLFVTRYYTGDGLVDIGIGGGRFVLEMGCRGYDINPHGMQWLGELDLFANVTQQPFDAMTFWDSLEHMIEWGHILANCRRWAFVSTPIYQGVYQCMRSKHYKPGEHVIYFTDRGLRWFMQQHGFEWVATEDFETRLGRESIGTFAFRRTQSRLDPP